MSNTSELTEEDKKRIEAEEFYRAKVRKNIEEEPETSGKKVPWWKPKGVGAWLIVLIIFFVILLRVTGINKIPDGSYNNEPFTPTLSEEQEQTWIKDEAKIYCDNHKKGGLRIPNPKYFEDKSKASYIDGSELVISDCESIINTLSKLYSKEEINNVAKSMVWIGMDPFRLTYSIGFPWDENKTVTSNLVHVQWVYGNPIYGASYYYFEGTSVDDWNTWKLTSWQD